jgi:subtilisin family serine protease
MLRRAAPRSGLPGWLLVLVLSAHPASAQTFRCAPDAILVRFADDVPLAQAQQDLAAAGLEPTTTFAALRLHRCRIVDGQDVDTAVGVCRAHPEVVYAEPDYIYTTGALPDDPRLPEQWALLNDTNTDIDVDEAWEVQTGARHVIVAVLDTGVDVTHEDLRDNLWHNPGESGGGRETNGLDDDHNGYVDDVMGWDFVTGSPAAVDDNGHGTHVAGIVAARGDNDTGITGVAWRTSIQSLRFLDRHGMGRASDAVAAILYASANGARVINASWGGPARSQALEEALEYARQHKVLVVAAAGNLSQDNDARPTYPASFELDNILAVSASDRDDQLASFSNFGRHTVDLVAPGVEILSTFPDDTYRTLSGTSMATPHVSGVAALLLAQFPSMPYRTMMIRLVGGSEPLLSLSNASRSGGRLNAYGALSTHPRIAFVEIAETIDMQRGVRIEAEVTDDDTLRAVSLHFSVEGGNSTVVDMQQHGTNLYRGSIPLQEPGSDIVFFVRAVDAHGYTGLSPTQHFSAGSR